MLNEAVDALAVQPDGHYIDATFGRGGHSRLVLSRLGAGGLLTVFDKDPLAIAEAQSLGDARVSIRLDGKAFHTLTREMDKPVDLRFQSCMWATAKTLCEKIQGVRLAYTQSDEISLLLVDYDSIKTQGWFDYDLQKMVSISASIATAAFNREFQQRIVKNGFLQAPLQGEPDRDAHFDSRAWNLPAHEVTNYFIWRQQDATRNSISSLAQAHFSHKELQGKKSAEMQDMLVLQKKVNWNDCPTPQKRGVCVVKETYTVECPVGFGPPGHGADQLDVTTERARWIIDDDIPIFTQDREYIEKHVLPKTDELEQADSVNTTDARGC